MGFQTTYEELKLAAASRFNVDEEIASRLPMRNWNKPTRTNPPDHGGPLPDYLWGIETQLWPERYHLRRASRLPMRNWNQSSSTDWILIYGFQTTYEELKQSPNGWKEVQHMSFQTTYEELKLSPDPSDVIYSGLPDYLWGIETQQLSQFDDSDTCFQTTYEELKLPAVFKVEMELLSFQTTYEELKQNWFVVNKGIGSLPDYLWGIETKLVRGKQRDRLASRLPMRNWNKHFRAVLTTRSSGLPDYLWGIETQQYCTSINPTMSASRLPMRNWNTAATVLGTAAAGFQTTYEELKPKKAIPNAAYIVLPDYLWGIETEISPYEERWYWFGFQTTYEELKLLSSPISKSRPSLPDYLWGIETCSQPTNRISLLPSFQTTYEELKPNFLAFLFCLRCHASRLPMRNWNSLPLPEVLEGYTASRLPMRNWNKSFSLVIEGMERLPDYLWGIETGRWPRREQLVICFQTTYEELKLLPIKTTWLKFIPLPDYLWGIETAI